MEVDEDLCIAVGEETNDGVFVDDALEIDKKVDKLTERKLGEMSLMHHQQLSAALIFSTRWV